jgi:hypothetical protein
MALLHPNWTSLGADGSHRGAFSFTSSALARLSATPAQQSSSRQEPGSVFGRERLCATNGLGLFILPRAGGGAARRSRGSPTDMKNSSCPAGVHAQSRRAGRSAPPAARPIPKPETPRWRAAMPANDRKADGGPTPPAAPTVDRTARFFRTRRFRQDREVTPPDSRTRPTGCRSKPSG